MAPRTIAKTLNQLRRPKVGKEIPTPLYKRPRRHPGTGVFLGVESMSRHTADAGWQLTLGFREAGYTLAGHNLDFPETNVKAILAHLRPGIVVMQDKREWLGMTAHVYGKNKAEHFSHWDVLRRQPELFRVTVLKDAQQRPEFHRNAAEEIQAHAWIIYYDPRIVKHVAPYVRVPHLVRTYHTVDADAVPEYTADRKDACLLSGAISQAYPIRSVLRSSLRKLPVIKYHRHPGYHAEGCVTPQFLKLLSQYKVAVCTSSKYGYALRKIIEATACGCRVITDLPVDEVLPEIDGNLYRLQTTSPAAAVQEVRNMASRLIRTYRPEQQAAFAEAAKKFYDYRPMGKRLVHNIETLRKNYA